MANYNNDRSDRGPRDDRRSFDRPQSDRGRSGDRPAPQLHPATCSKCGKSCMVPFIATGNRPIFCRDCFKTEGGRDEHGAQDRRSGSSFDRDRRMYDAVCDKCGNRCQVPFQPREGKEVLCSHCFEQKGKEERSTYETRPQASVDLTAVNAKLDKILKLLETLEVVAVDTQKVAPYLTDSSTEEGADDKMEKKSARTPSKKAATKAPAKKKATKKTAATAKK